MKKGLLLLVIGASVSMFANATIRRVGFFGTFIKNVDYADFTSAYAAAVSGDTILVFPGINNVTGQINKKLIIIGPGSLLDPTATPAGNANEQANTGVATISNVSFTTGSEGSLITGFTGGNYDLEASNVTVQRNRSLNITLAINPVVTTGIQILQNYEVNISSGNTNGASITNLNVSNNFIYSFYTPPGNTYAGLISNNVWAFDNTQSAGNANGGATTMSTTNNIELGGGAYLIENNIFESYTNAVASTNYNYFKFVNGGNSIFNYNLSIESGTPMNWGAGTGNVITPIGNAASIFQAFPVIGSTSGDGRYQLAVGSPALTVGVGNTPIGMFAGPNPYKLSLIPAIPSIYQLSSPQGNNPTGNTITINVSTRGNN